MSEGDQPEGAGAHGLAGRVAETARLDPLRGSGRSGGRVAIRMLTVARRPVSDRPGDGPGAQEEYNTDPAGRHLPPDVFRRHRPGQHGPEGDGSQEKALAGYRHGGAAFSDEPVVQHGHQREEGADGSAQHDDGVGQIEYDEVGGQAQER